MQMRSSPKGAPATRGDISALLGDAGDALDGFPVSELLGLCQNTPSGGSCEPDHGDPLVDRTLAAWIAGLNGAIASHAMSTVKVLTAQKASLARTRDALVRLQRELHRPH